LAAAITAATTRAEYRRGAQRVAALLRDEDGPGAAVAAVERIAEEWSRRSDWRPSRPSRILCPGTSGARPRLRRPR
jgi:hypothetical protein